MRTVRLQITGRVQGVGYRDFVRSEAQMRGLAGWVRNRRDGSVEALVGGPSESVEDLIAACWRGPPAARVAEVRAEAAEQALGPGFAVLATA